LAIVVGAWAQALAGEARTQARLVFGAEAARPGETVLVGIHFKMAAGWHIYWRNPGESGMPTSVEWVLPPGVTAGAMLWPPPEPFVADDMTTFVYEREAMLIVPLTLASNLAAGPLELKAKAAWLECEVACVPGDAELAGRIEVAAARRPGPEHARIETWLNRMPKPGSPPEVRSKSGSALTAEKVAIVISGAVDGGLVPKDFYAYASEAVEVLPAVRVLSAEAGRFKIEKTLHRLGSGFPEKLTGILVQQGDKDNPTRAVEVVLTLPGTAAGGAGVGKATESETAPVVNPTPNPKPGPGPGAISTPATVSGTAAGAPGSGTVDQGPGAARGIGSSPVPGVGTDVGTGAPAASRFLFWQMLGLAFLGGLILNIMPCVLPVIALKILGFVQQSQESPARVRRLGLLYAVGVVASFLVLAGVVLGVRAAGDAASWGMQMQNLYFRTVLTAVVVLVALNLFGLFEVNLGGGAMGAAAGLAAREGGWGAFFNGVLATALATPCTAPFLTVALGFAFTQPAGVVVLLFVATALGLAAPYVVLSWQPGWLKFLPKPGAWMVRFKVAMGFLMLATAVWLFDLTAPSYGEGGVLWLGLFLVLVALAAWVWGEFVQRSRARRGLAGTVAVGLGVLAYGLALESQLDWRHPAPPAVGGDVVRDTADGIEWHRWSPSAVEQAQAAGRPVLVDFTARWCLTCKTNKRLAIDIPAVRARLREINGIAFRADYTDKDPRIAAELQRYQRAGVPLVLVFPRGAKAPPEVLPAALTPGIVLEALTKAAR
jgi:thiol:disulfide interchange protein DsbD